MLWLILMFSVIFQLDNGAFEKEYLTTKSRYIREKTPSQMFDRFLDTPLAQIFVLLQRYAMLFFWSFLLTMGKTEVIEINSASLLLHEKYKHEIHIFREMRKKLSNILFFHVSIRISK